MANQLFKELVKLAAVKAAFTYGDAMLDPGMGGRRGRGRGRGVGIGNVGGGMWQRDAYGNTYMGPHPAFVPGAVAGQQAGVTDYAADVGERGPGAAREYAQDQAGYGRKGTAFSQTMVNQQSKDERNSMQGFQDAYAKSQAEAAKQEAIIREHETQQALRYGKAEGLRAQVQHQGLLGSLWGSVGFGQNLKMEAEDAIAKSNAMGKHTPQAVLDARTERTRLLNEGANYQKLYMDANKTMQDRGNSAWNNERGNDQYREDDFRAGREAQRDAIEQRRSAANQARAGLLGQKAPEPRVPRTPPAAAEAPTITPTHVEPVSSQPLHLPASPVTPIPRPLAPKPLVTPKPGGSMRFLPTTIDQLVEGAARSMFDRYVKVAQAKLAVELATAKTLGKKWGTPETLAKPEPQSQSKPQVLTTASYLTKDRGEFNRRLNEGLTKKGNSMPLPSHVQKMLNAARSGSSSPGESSVDLGEHRPGRGPSPMRETPPAGNSQMPTEASPKKLLPPSNPKATQIMPTSDIDAMLELEQLRKAHMANPAIAAERAAFAAKHGPKPGAGSQFFRARATVPQGKMAAARVLCLS